MAPTSSLMPYGPGGRGSILTAKTISYRPQDILAPQGMGARRLAPTRGGLWLVLSRARAFKGQGRICCIFFRCHAGRLRRMVLDQGDGRTVSGRAFRQTRLGLVEERNREAGRMDG
jgi:hypothetical protein